MFTHEWPLDHLNFSASIGTYGDSGPGPVLFPISAQPGGEHATSFHLHSQSRDSAWITRVRGWGGTNRLTSALLAGLPSPLIISMAYCELGIPVIIPILVYSAGGRSVTIRSPPDMINETSHLAANIDIPMNVLIRPFMFIFL